MSQALLAASLPFDVELGSLLVANMLSAWLDNEVVEKATEAAYESSQKSQSIITTGWPMFTSGNQLPAKSFTIRRARNASMRCAGKRRNWVGAKLRSGL